MLNEGHKIIMSTWDIALYYVTFNLLFWYLKFKKIKTNNKENGLIEKHMVVKYYNMLKADIN